MTQLQSYLPKYYAKSAVMAAALLPAQNELDLLDAEIDDTKKQLIITTATTALTLYEQDLGITPNESEDYATRRARILAKLRGLGTITKSALINIVKSYIDGTITVTEVADEYTINIKFITRKGIPGTIDDIKKAIDEVIPAHLAVNYVFTYRTWNDVEELVGTWDDVSAYTWDGLSLIEVLPCLYIDEDTGTVYYRSTNDGNAILIYDDDGNPYARPYDEGE